MSTPSLPLTTRFAPSPTGHLHIGGARTALFCWAYAKKIGGRFMLRIEDTDAARSSEESARGIMDDLAWLGIEWEDGPKLTLPGGRIIGAAARDAGSYFQAQRIAIYNKYLEQLVRSGRAYPAFESSASLEAERKKAVAAKQTYRYPRPADIEFGKFTPAMEERWKRAQADEPHVLRFAAPANEIIVHDQVLGDVKIAAGELDDFVIRKADGFPTYHFAVVVDDETMGVTHVLRAQEHLANTPRHVALQDALGFRHPVYGHMPLIFNMDGTKMSKRDKAKTARKAAKDAMAKNAPEASGRIFRELAYVEQEAEIQAFLRGDNDSVLIAEHLAKVFGVTLPEIEVWDFRTNGYLPEAITNYVSLLGWNPGMKLADGKDLEKFDNKFLAEHFSLDRIGKTPSKFDRAKLLSFNADAIAALTDDQFVARWTAWMTEHEPDAAAKLARLSPVQMRILAAALKPRAKTFRDALKPASFAMKGDQDSDFFDPVAVEKNLKSGNGAGLEVLRKFEPSLQKLSESDWTPANIHHVIQDFADKNGMPNPGGIAQPLRVAVTGTSVSPGLGETLAVLGKPSTHARLTRALAL